ncbi:hypothetical protein [Solimonas flava]|uniref:hypothetical protein n=1 Tax=Solimonas flava TaxID=415849 RepID=UPI0003FF31C7|nr:hypothetical protein [Solimonas flava]
MTDDTFYTAAIRFSKADLKRIDMADAAVSGEERRLIDRALAESDPHAKAHLLDRVREWRCASEVLERLRVDMQQAIQRAARQRYYRAKKARNGRS